MSGRGKAWVLGGKKAKPSPISEYKWLNGTPVAIMSRHDNGTKVCAVPRSALPELLSAWLDNRLKDAENSETPTCNIEIDDDENEQLLEYLKQKDVDKFYNEGKEEDDEDKEEEDEDEDAEVEDTSDVMEHINAFMSDNFVDWCKNMPSPNMPIKIVAYFNITGEL